MEIGGGERCHQYYFPNQLQNTIEDNGIFYNLLERENPDTELPLEDRKIGGLGVFLVKNMVEHMEYQRIEDRNRVKVTVSWDE